MPDARLFRFGPGGDPDVAPRSIKIPRDEAKLVRTRIQIHVEVLAVGQNAVIVRKQHLTGEEARKFVQIQKISDPRGEFLSAVHAEPVYRLFGLRGLNTSDWPAPDS